MKPTTLAQLAHCTNGRIVQGNPNVTVTGIAINSRTVQRGDAFVAFTGQQVDGHAFVAAAFAAGAALAIVTNMASCDVLEDKPILLVDDAQAAIQRIARFERADFSGPVIGVTGSNGKTTTKEMLASVFQAQGPCLYTTGNHNNELGLPLTILQRNDAHGSMILEMGMRGRGQIAALCEIAQPTAGIITNIGQSHLELLGTQENIARAKAELLEALPTNGIAVLCLDDAWSTKIAHRSNAPVQWYSVATPCAAYATQIEQTTDGMLFIAHIYDSSTEVRLPTFGLHNIQNALGAMLIGAYHGISLAAMAAQLTTLPSTSGRLRVLKGQAGEIVIDDCYNASPLSMKASLHVLRSLADGRKSVAILGDMYELGDYEEAGHREVGGAAAALDVDTIVAVGPLAWHMAEAARASGHRRVLHFASKEDALGALPDIIGASDVVLVKASRGMALEAIVHALVLPDES